MGFLTDQELGSLRITNMSLHVVGDGDFTPEPAREIEHAEFFIARIQDTDVSSVYSFKEASQTKACIERIARGEDNFESGAQQLSRDFSGRHVGASKDGAFFIFELATDDPTVKIYSLIKYDYREAIEQSNGEEGSLLRKIVHAFIADKKAIQKSVIVRAVNGVAELAISTRDRMKKQPEIVDYFSAFLDAERSLSDQELNERVVSVIRQTLSACKSLLPNENIPQAFGIAKGILRDRQQINDDAIIEAILAAAGNPDSEDSRSELEAQTRRKIRAAKLEGLVFTPDPQILRRPPMRKIKTTEGVTLIYPDDADGLTVTRAQKEGGGETITIQTEMVTEDSIVSDGTR